MDHNFGAGDYRLIHFEVEVTAATMKARKAILGFGITGQSVARYLLARGENPVVLDTRPAKPIDEEFSQLEIHWQCNVWPEKVLPHTATVIVSPGLPLGNCLLEQARSSGLTVISDIDLFFDNVTAPVIGVTGTNGKSTVVSLVGHILRSAGYKCAVGGNLGEAALDLIDNKIDFYVLELSSFQLEHSRSLPLARSVILNITEDHVDHHGSVRNYVAAKQKILADAKSWIYSREDASTQGADFAAMVSFGLDKSAAQDAWGIALEHGQEWVFRGELAICASANLPLQGRHNVLNCMAAMALVESWVEPSSVVSHIGDFQGLAHRFQAVAEIAGVAFVNDSKATNVGSTKAALDGLERKANVVLIAGGDAKGADLQTLADSLTGRVKRLVTLGKDGPGIGVLADQCGIAHVAVASIEDAVTAAVQDVAAGDMVLLSPACSSLDMFDNFQQRGEVFARAVGALTVADLPAVQA
ncbi:MAG: UDP-N-acetylmuramoylalanine--D-glutamate ligase [Candidatus Azotimanducaceae bacterium]